MKQTLTEKKIKVDGKPYTLKALTIKQIRPIMAGDYKDDVSIAAYLSTEGTAEVDNMEFIENQPASEISHYSKLAQEIMDFNNLSNTGNNEKK